MSKAAEAFRTIGEVADELDVKKHVLRFWEGKFPAIKPMKRGGGRRYYRPEDLALLRGIRHLLHAEGYTIKGVQKLLREQGIEHVKLCAPAEVEVVPAEARRRGRRPIKSRAPAATTTAAARQAELALEAAASAPREDGAQAVAEKSVPVPASAPQAAALARPNDIGASGGSVRAATIGRVLVDLKALRAFVAVPSLRDDDDEGDGTGDGEGDSAAPYMEDAGRARSSRASSARAAGGQRQAR